MIYFPRMLDKIRLHGRGELHEDYHENLGAPRTLDGACCNFLRINYDDLRERIPAVPGATHRRERDSAVVRRLGRGVGELSRLLPDHAAARLSVRRFHGAQAIPAHAGQAACGAAGSQSHRVADRPRRVLETGGL